MLQGMYRHFKPKAAKLDEKRATDVVSGFVMICISDIWWSNFFMNLFVCEY